ncbi:MAG: DUF805 domain-containing protein [Candidatus Contendobacter sp.]|nr:DUF805 domain-containing protein [Candidatus Contendobacter sp.]
MNSDASPYQPPHSAITPIAPPQFGELNVFSTRGRLGRVRYIGYSIGLVLLVYLFIAILGGAVLALVRPHDGNEAFQWLGGGAVILLVLVMLAASLLLTIQRLHDFNASGWWALLMAVPVASFVLYLVLLIMPGTQGSNRFGYPPPPNTLGVILLASILPLIFVLGIVAAIAIPAYQNYKVRAQALHRPAPTQPLAPAQQP